MWVASIAIWTLTFSAVVVRFAESTLTTDARFGTNV